jgi:hypothetical protein
MLDVKFNKIGTKNMNRNINMVLRKVSGLDLSR